MPPSSFQPELIEQDTKSSTPVASGEVKEGFHALLEGCGVCELGWRGYAMVTGADRTRWLNGMITNNIRDLPAGAGVYSFLLTPQGRIQGDLYAYNLGDSIFLAIDKSQIDKVLTLLRKYIIMDKVEITGESNTLKAIAVVGPKAREVLRSIDLEFPDLPPLSFADVGWKDSSLRIIRSDRPRIESYEVWGASEAVATLRSALQDSGATLVGSAALDLLRIAEGIPQFGHDIRERDLPQETGQDRALSFTKGCYIGQEIVERIRARGAVHRKFTGFEVAGPLPAPGTKIHIENKEVGGITSSSILPLRGGDYPVALGYIRREIESAGKEIDVEGAKLTLTELPFSQVFKD